MPHILLRIRRLLAVRSVIELLSGGDAMASRGAWARLQRRARSLVCLMLGVFFVLYTLPFDVFNVDGGGGGAGSGGGGGSGGSGGASGMGGGGGWGGATTPINGGSPAAASPHECMRLNAMTISQEPAFKHKPGWRTRCTGAGYDAAFTAVGQSLRGFVLTLGKNLVRPPPPLPGLDALADVAEGRAPFVMELPGYRGAGGGSDGGGGGGGDGDEGVGVGVRALRSLFAGPTRRVFIERQLRRFASCAVVVTTVSFGAQDSLHQPTNLSPASSGVVCFVAFVDRPTIDRFNLGVCMGMWNVVDYGDAGFAARPPLTTTHSRHAFRCVQLKWRRG